jgi:hypothetical protein
VTVGLDSLIDIGLRTPAPRGGSAVDEGAVGGQVARATEL